MKPTTPGEVLLLTSVRLAWRNAHQCRWLRTVTQHQHACMAFTLASPPRKWLVLQSWQCCLVHPYAMQHAALKTRLQRLVYTDC